ncbi:MAG: proton-conducting transporter membrane subunit [Candidatus Acidiferrales bacterium]
MHLVSIEMGLIFLLASLGLVAPLVLMTSQAKTARVFAITLIVGSNVVGCIVAVLCFWRESDAVVDLSRFTPFPFALGIDRLSALFLLLICTVAVPVSIFAVSYFDKHYAEQRRSWVWAFFSLFLLSMIIVVTASTGFAFLIGWELMTLLSAGLILMEGDSTERRHNVFIYLLMMHAGAAAVVASFFLFLPYSHSLDFASMRTASGAVPAGIRTLIFVLALLGFGTKAGIIPLHLWLPRAHPIAPSPVSALMSGVMLKTAVYGFVRFAFDLLGGGPWWCGYVVLSIGAVSGLLGILYAIAENDLKRLLAYSSVENIGIIFLGLGSSLIFLAHHAPVWAALALVGALLHAFNHALFKSLLFLGAGAISSAAHTVNLEELGGLQRRMPFSGATLLVACCSISGLPLFNGFVSEWLTFRSFLGGSVLMTTRAPIVLLLMVGVLALIGGLAAACFVKVFGVAFLGRPRTEAAEHADEVPIAMRTGLGMLAAACLWIGIVPGFFLRPLVSLAQILIPGAGVPQETLSIARVIPWTAAIILGVSIAVALLKRRERMVRTWACGLPGLTSRMQYTSTVFSKPIRFVFSSVYRPERKIDRLPEDQPYFPVTITYRSVRTTSYERTIYQPFVEMILSAAHQLRRMQTGNIQVYLLYIFLALVSLLAMLRFQK